MLSDDKITEMWKEESKADSLWRYPTYNRFARRIEAQVRAEYDPNANWLSLAHSICFDQGIPGGPITERLKQLQAKLTRENALNELVRLSEEANLYEYEQITGESGAADSGAQVAEPSRDASSVAHQQHWDDVSGHEICSSPMSHSADSGSSIYKSDPQNGVKEAVRTAPKTIYLQISDDEAHLDEPFPYGEEVTWCADSVVGAEVKYIRADLAKDSHE